VYQWFMAFSDPAGRRVAGNRSVPFGRGRAHPEKSLSSTHAVRYFSSGVRRLALEAPEQRTPRSNSASDRHWAPISRESGGLWWRESRRPLGRFHADLDQAHPLNSAVALSRWRPRRLRRASSSALSSSRWGGIGAHLNPAVSIAFVALRGDFPWRRVPLYVAAQFAGAILATLLLVALLGRRGTAGLT
jgi:hypothetical protein